MYFIIDLPLSVDWKGNIYNSILVIVDCLPKMVYYKLVKTTINIVGLAKIIVDIEISYYGLLESIVNN